MKRLPVFILASILLHFAILAGFEFQYFDSIANPAIEITLVDNLDFAPKLTVSDLSFIPPSKPLSVGKNLQTERLNSTTPKILKSVNIKTTEGSPASGGINLKPIYPTMSRIKGEEGLVTLRINRSKLPAENWEVEILKSSGYERLDQSAVNAVYSAINDQIQIPDNQIQVQFSLQ